jgi:hypothetical protein
METRVGDLVLIYVEGKPAAYARVEDMEPDIKPGWLRVKLLVLTVPIQLVTWILQPEQVDGTPFTMGGTPMRLERVRVPPPEEGEPPEEIPKEQRGKVISLMERRKEK